MSGPFAPGVGAVFSADIAVPEHEREMRFYSRVLSTGETAALARDGSDEQPGHAHHWLGRAQR